MKRFVYILATLCLLMPIKGVHASEIDVSDTPDWVVRHAAGEPANLPETQISNGVYFILLDRQVFIGRDQTHRYLRIVKKVLTPQGVENASEIYIDYDPAYEQLRLHRIDIHRDGRTIGQLQLEKVTAFQRESDLERRLYNGQKTASIILEDTRPGDLIEFAYTISGRNPVFQDRYADTVDAAWSVPLARLHYRWIFDNGRPVAHRAYNCRRKMASNRTDKGVEYSYTDKDIGAVLIDSDLPVWYLPYPWIQISQFAGWTDVSGWGEALYRVPRNVSPALQSRIELLKQCATSEEKIAQALCLVQNEVRYLGIEIGEGSHQPTAPDVTYGRKFGDCKDKSILLCTLLDKLDIRARPALVNTHLYGTIQDMLPSPQCFNHVVVQVVDKGETYWVDPTEDCQALPLDIQYQALYGKALVLDKDTEALTDTGEHVLSKPSKEVYEEFDLTRGVGQAADFTVKTICRGREADLVRRHIKATGYQQSAKSYLNFYAADYPSIFERKPLSIDNNPDSNALIVTEYYRIPLFWKLSEEEKSTEAVFHCTEFRQLFQQPETTVRSMPIGLKHPEYITQRTTVKLPEPWNVASEKGKVENDALLFTYDIDYAEKVLTLGYSYRSKQDFVAAGKTAGYIADLNSIKDNIGYALTSYKQAASAATGGAAREPVENSGSSWFMVGVALAGLIAALCLGLAAWRYDPPPKKSSLPEKPALAGLGGWLILVMLGLFTRPVIFFQGMVDLLPAFQLAYWRDIDKSVHPDYVTAFKALLGCELFFNIVFFILLLTLLVLFFKKRTSFPVLFIVVALAQVLVGALDTAAGYYIADRDAMDYEESRQLVRMGIFAVVWISYMRKSTRVRQTFQARRYRKACRDAAGDVPQNACCPPEVPNI